MGSVLTPQQTNPEDERTEAVYPIFIASCRAIYSLKACYFESDKKETVCFRRVNSCKLSGCRAIRPRHCVPRKHPDDSEKKG